MKDNKLIAEFMGVKPTILGDEITYEMYGAIDCIEDGLDEQHFFLEEELMFHTSWDWLMPVIQKCYKVENEEGFDSIVDAVSTLDIDGTYKAVVEFIKDQVCHVDLEDWQKQD
tara:strand:- start:107 stop:445 length:339 start_codon:yes stop_codon:yes gene_type:complete